MNLDELNGITEEAIIRHRREKECFPYINRGALWYNHLTQEQKAELTDWYHAWLDAPQTGVVPVRPTWLN